MTREESSNRKSEVSRMIDMPRTLGKSVSKKQTISNITKSRLLVLNYVKSSHRPTRKK